MVNTIWKARKNNFLGLPWTFTVYGFSEDRLYIQSGILNTREDEVRLYRITDITLTKSFWQRIMGMGTIRISSSDKSMGDFELKNLPQLQTISVGDIETYSCNFWWSTLVVRGIFLILMCND